MRAPFHLTPRSFHRIQQHFHTFIYTLIHSLVFTFHQNDKIFLQEFLMFLYPIFTFFVLCFSLLQTIWRLLSCVKSTCSVLVSPCYVYDIAFWHDSYIVVSFHFISCRTDKCKDSTSVKAFLSVLTLTAKL